MTARKLVLSMEDADTTVLATIDDAEATTTASELDVAADEVAAIGDEAAAHDEGQDIAHSAADELGAVGDVLQGAVASGEGIDETSAKLASIAIESICGRVGIDARASRVVPALESFGSNQSRQQATTFALEGVGEQVKRIWEAIKKGAAAVWNFVKNLFVGLVKNRKLAEKHLAGLAERAKTIPADAKPAKAKLSAGAATFSIGGKASVETAEQILSNSIDLLGAGAKAVTLAQEQASTLLNNKKPSLDAVGKAFNGLRSAAGAQQASSDAKSEVYGNYAGGKSIVITFGDNNALSISIEKTEKESAKEIEAPSKGDLIKLIGDAQKVLKSLADYEKVAGKIEGVTSTAAKLADKIISAAGSFAKEGEEKTNHEGAAAAVKALNKAAGTLGSAVPATVFAAVKGVGDLATAGIANLKTEAKDTAAA